ncbi:MAG: hypothetical protein PHU46_12415 [Rhodocyclaceae bacterium]|nr:hypothetical protein [Rhodocyclaceae bacterium]
MMASEGWGDKDTIYRNLLTQWPSGNNGGTQGEAITWYQREYSNVDKDEIILQYGGTPGTTIPNARALIDHLLHDTTTATAFPEDQYPEGSPDDPVGIGFWAWKLDDQGNPVRDNQGNPVLLGHAITVWADDANGLTVTDSDDNFDGPKLYHWVNDTQFNYGGTTVTVGYVSFMADTPEIDPASGTSALTLLLGSLGLLSSRRRSLAAQVF